jgi:hypothetical protein
VTRHSSAPDGIETLGVCLHGEAELESDSVVPIQLSVPHVQVRRSKAGGGVTTVQSVLGRLQRATDAFFKCGAMQIDNVALEL